MEVRTAYCSTDFEWDNTKRVAVKEMDKSNQRILSKHAEAAFAFNTEESSSDRARKDGDQ